MLKLFFKSKILISIWLVSIIIISSLFFFIPYITEKNLIELVKKNSQNNVEQIKLTRSYYLDWVVKDIKNSNIKSLSFGVNHKNSSHILPLPATTIHDLSDLFSQNSGVKFSTYSNFPFKNRKNRVLTQDEKQTLRDIESSGGIVIKKKQLDGKAVLIVAIADYMSNISCVNCHNNHSDKMWENNKWKVGDIRGVIEVTTPLEESLMASKKMRNMILLFIAFVFFVLFLYYSYMLLRREEELLKVNEILDERVKAEILKNQEKEQVLIQKAKLSSQGEMINSIAHQWRQPINELSSIFMNLEFKHSMNKLSKEMMILKVSKAENILTFMSNTIEDFRNFFKLDKEKVSFNLHDLVDEILNISNITFAQNSIKVHKSIDKEQEIFAYKNELAQVLLNLLENAKDALVEKKIEEPSIFISLKKSKSTLYISVKDNAKGIPKEHMAKIFDLYFSTKLEGSGIGLYISKLIIEKHFNGKIKVLSTKNGAEFIVEIRI
ncbi:ATP-binding protein [Sulfurimonas sp.]|uniref:ATP-binding protein n=1 Tax=Sulfurimonas sp. TaxID=2022749 RepID=UPI002B4713EE|nr:ATP-binding protein [Sulfurimonas sp.]